MIVRLQIGFLNFSAVTLYTMVTHPLDALLAPRSIALVGASAKPDSSGYAMISMSRIDGFTGKVFLVNPRYETIEEQDCYKSLLDLPEKPDHVVIGVASRFVEDIFDQIISLEIRSATIFASCYLEDDTTPILPERIRRKAKKADIRICGANCMGFYNPSAGLRVASFPSVIKLRKGGIAWIAQSGSAFAALAHSDSRLGFSICVSTGMELVTTISDYIDWSLDQTETKVIGVFLESVRDPQGFVAALKKALKKRIPIVVLKVGRTEKSAKMALTHTGAIAGNDAAYTALFDRYGVTQVSDLDEMAATLAMFDIERKPGEGKLATIHDSGGERELVVDLAERFGLEFADITDDTKSKLSLFLEPGLDAENPLDVFGTNTDYVNRYAKLIKVVMDDPNVGIGLYMSDPRDGYWYAEGYTDAVIEAFPTTNKPIAMVSNNSLGSEPVIAKRLRDEGIPLIRGTRNALHAVQHVLAWRDFKPVDPGASDGLDKGLVRRWADQLSRSSRLPEHEGLKLFSDFGLNVPTFAVVADNESLSQTLDSKWRYPLVLKTAEGIAHKTEAAGVILGLSNREDVQGAYQKISDALGPRALLMETAPKGIEIGLGAIVDPHFGPVIVISAGGMLIEFLNDKVTALAPIGVEDAKHLLSTLRIFKLLQGVRGEAPADIEGLATQIARFSTIVAALSKQLVSVDINPLIVSADGVWAVDCLVVSSSKEG